MRGTNAFRCRDCDAVTHVLETNGDGDVTLRIRECENGHRFETREVFSRDVTRVPGRGPARKEASHA